MTGYTVHTGSSEKFSEGWDRIFTGGKKAAKKAVGSKSAKKSSAKKTAKKKAGKGKK